MNILEDKTIFITGAAGILGKSHIENFLSLGATAIATDKKIDALLSLKKDRKDISDRLIVEELDATDEMAVEALFAKLQDLQPNVFINNAAVTGEQLDLQGEVPSAFADCSLESWNIVLSANLTSAFLIAREVDRSFIGKYPCKLLNISSVYGLYSPHHEFYADSRIKPFAAYSASKAGIHGLTVWLSGYWAHRDATVNTLSPGGVFNNQGNALVSEISRLNMMSRMAQPAEVSAVLSFLCSSASDYMTGQNIYVDGGFSAW